MGAAVGLIMQNVWLTPHNLMELLRCFNEISPKVAPFIRCVIWTAWIHAWLVHCMDLKFWACHNLKSWIRNIWTNNYNDVDNNNDYFIYIELYCSILFLAWLTRACTKSEGAHHCNDKVVGFRVVVPTQKKNNNNKKILKKSEKFKHVSGTA